MIFAQFSDLHIVEKGRLAYGVVDTAAMLAAAVDHLGRLPFPVDFVLATGDLVDHGTAQEYAHLRALLSPLRVPCYFVIGNHDAREALRASFACDGALALYPASGAAAGKPPAPHGSRAAGEGGVQASGGYAQPLAICASGLEESGFLHYTIEAGGLRIVVLDTVVPGEGGGELCAARLAWLKEQLAQHKVPTVIAMHHPPFATGIAHMDAISLKGADAFEEIVAGHAQVRRIVCGHLHRAIQADVAHTTAITAPSVAHQIVLNLGGKGAASEVSPAGLDGLESLEDLEGLGGPEGLSSRQEDLESKEDLGIEEDLGGLEGLVMEPPGYLLHWWNGRRLTTHQTVIGNYPGPFPFRSD